jgi:hypothetical protein
MYGVRATDADLAALAGRPLAEIEAMAREPALCPDIWVHWDEIGGEG